MTFLKKFMSIRQNVFISVIKNYLSILNTTVQHCITLKKKKTFILNLWICL